MDHLSKAQVQLLETKLRSEASTLQASLADQADALAATEAPDPRDTEDAAADEAGRYREGQLRERQRARLAEVEAALERMAEGDYGICEDSGDEIPFRRLELEPTARLTVEAQEQREEEAGVADRHEHEPIGY